MTNMLRLLLLLAIARSSTALRCLSCVSRETPAELQDIPALIFREAIQWSAQGDTMSVSVMLTAREDGARQSSGGAVMWPPPSDASTVSRRGWGRKRGRGRGRTVW